MKSLPFLLFLIVLPSVPAAEFYLWQRNWGVAVENAAKHCSSPLLLFAAELSAKKTVRSGAPRELWEREDVTAVFRLRVDALNPAGFSRLAAEIARNGCPKVQLDADVPERRLAEYAEHLETLRSVLPPQVKEFSVTALPCHLGHAEFSAVAAQADYYVLQLHGIDAPARIDEPYALIDGTTARTAIRRARELGRPFRIALPCYAYRLEFDADGNFTAIAAEGAPPPSDSRRYRLAPPDPELLATLIRENPDLERIWFRLPVEGDRLCYDLASIEAFERGEIPSPRLAIELRRTAPNALELWITPHAQLRLEPMELSLEWPDKHGEFELAPGTKTVPEKLPFGILPERLTVEFPGCGAEVRAATFLVNKNNHPTVKEIKP